MDAPDRHVPPARRQGTRNRISHETVVTGSLADSLWASYYEAFSPLEELALLCHLYSRATFDELLRNPDIIKIVGWQDGKPVGMSMVTNHLHLVPQISPKFLHRKYPEHAERNAIYFGIILFLASGVRSRTLFARLSVATCQLVSADNGVLVMDFSDHILNTHAWESKLEMMSTIYHGAGMERLDAQSYWALTLPEPLADDSRLVDVRHRAG